MVLWKQASISNGFRDIQCQMFAMVDMILMRPLNTDRGHFGTNRFLIRRLPIGSQ